ncbi:MAG: DUF1211 domain-containing protein [Burkholderiaceae bacterium]|nr:DUF1211 domain-containing protein [Burkholderiaceae bacterium]
MGKGRLEAFSDGVLAVIITIMVLELKVPMGGHPDALLPLLPVFLSYVLSFIYVGIYWSNHHHLMHAVRHVSGATLWANLHLLFWLSLVPFSTAWMGENHWTPLPVALYGFVLMMAGMAYSVLVWCLRRTPGQDPLLEQAMGRDFKGKVSVVIYAMALPLAYVHVALPLALYLTVALIWLVPDRRIEKRLHGDELGH